MTPKTNIAPARASLTTVHTPSEYVKALSEATGPQTINKIRKYRGSRSNLDSVLVTSLTDPSVSGSCARGYLFSTSRCTPSTSATTDLQKLHSAAAGVAEASVSVDRERHRPGDLGQVRHAGSVFEFDYKLTGSGWSEARIADDDRHAIITASYLSDALRFFLEAVALVVEGHAEARCSWDEEPGEYRWILRRTADALSVEILAFDHLWGDEPDEAGREVFSTVQDPMRVARVVLSAAQRVLDDLGAAEYERQWVEHPFPAEALERLRAAIQSARGGTT